MEPEHIPNQTLICSRLLTKDELEQGRKRYLLSLYPTNLSTLRTLPGGYVLSGKILKSMVKKRLSMHAAMYRCGTNFLHNTKQKVIKCAFVRHEVISYLVDKVLLKDIFPVYNSYALQILVGQLLWGNKSIPLRTIETVNLFYYEFDMKEKFVEADIVLSHANSCRLPTYVRVNTLSISLEQCINAFCKEGWKLIPYQKSYTDYLAVISSLNEREFIRDFHISELLVFPVGTSFYQHPGYLKGKFVLQDKGSCLASFLLNPKPGSVVLDMCAAPGKTTNHLANIINNEGIVYAVDNHPDRYNRLCSFLELTNVKCAETIWSDNTQVKMDNVNYVLVDGPSTYTGIFHKRTKKGLNRKFKKNFNSCYKSLIYAFRTFTSAKRIVYSSCTNFPQEGENVVHKVLEALGNSYTLLDVKELLWNEWYSTGKKDEGNFFFADKCLRINPKIDKSFGYFIAVFERNFEVLVPISLWNIPMPENFCEFNEVDSGDESSNDDNDVKKPTAPPLVKKSAKFQYHKPAISKKKKVFENAKPVPGKNRTWYKPRPFLLPTPPASTLTNQIPTNNPGSRPFYEIGKSQPHP